MTTNNNEAQKKKDRFSKVKHETLSLQLHGAVGGNASLGVALVYY